MTATIRCRMLFIGIIAVLWPACSRHRTDTAETLAITHVTVVDVRTGALRPNHTVVIRGNRIEAVGSSTELRAPRHSTIVSGAGGFLIPGLWDMHVHAARDGRAPRFWPLFLAYGITGIRETGSYLDSLLHWRSVAQANPDQAPHIVWSSPMIDGDPPLYDHAHVVHSPEEAKAVAALMRAYDFDYLKVYSGLSRDAFLALSDEARQIGLAIAGEVPNEVTPVEAAAAGMRSFEHLWNLFEWCVPTAAARRDKLQELDRIGADESIQRPVREKQYQAWLSYFDTACVDSLASDLARHGTWQVPTLVVNRSYSHIDSAGWNTDSRRNMVPTTTLEEWEILRTELLAEYGPLGVAAWRARYAREADMLRRMRDAGVGILAGSDASNEPFVYPGSSLHEELELLVEAGLTPLQALQAATFNAAMFLDRGDIGVVEAGRQGDLVLLDADPLTDIRNTRQIRAVVYRGRVLGRPQLDSLVALAQARARN
jgi:hypothetical protein